MHIHLMRVQKTGSQRQWWIKGDNAKDDLMKFAPKVTQREAITIFELEYDGTETKLYTYNGTFSPAEAAMTVADILRGHEKKEG